jgi:hypothetical protein
MQLRGDRDHDIAAYFVVNQGRVAEVKDGHRFSSVAATPGRQLPPSGPPGIKGRRLRASVQAALNQLQAGDESAAIRTLQEAVRRYDASEM